MPLFHGQGLLMQFYGTLQAGGFATLVRKFSPSVWIDEVRKCRATVTNMLGVMIDFILKQPRKPTDRDNNLRLLNPWPVTESTLRQLHERFGVDKFHNLFGMTECNIPVARPFELSDYSQIDAPASCGKVWDEIYEVIIADPETDEPVPAGTVGEILIRSKEPFCFMSEYSNMPDKTAESMRNFWYHSGDAGRIDPDGNFYFIDRIKDSIRRRGENISSYEVEVVVLEYPAIDEAAVTAVKAEEGGEDEVIVYVVLKPGEELDPIKLLDHCAERMPHFAVPRYVEVVEEFPKTPTNKVQKMKLRDRGITAATWDRDSVGYRVKKR
jgi:crotonobetaine/carnitine-CoA ligase